MSQDSENEWGGGGDELPGDSIAGDEESRGSGSSDESGMTDLPGDGNQGAVSNPKYPPPVSQGE